MILNLDLMWSRPNTGSNYISSSMFLITRIAFPLELVIQSSSLCQSLMDSTVMIWWLRQTLFQPFYWILSFLEIYFKISSSDRLLFHTVVSLWIQLNWTSIVVHEIQYKVWPQKRGFLTFHAGTVSGYILITVKKIKTTLFGICA